MSKNTLPEWYPAPFHQRPLSMQEWAIEIHYRVFGISLYFDNKISKDRAIINFEDFVINGKRDGFETEAYNVFPVSILPNYKSEKEGHIKLPAWDIRDTGRIVPNLINLDFDDETIIRHVKATLQDRRQYHKGDHFERLIEEALPNTPFAPKKYTPTVPMKKGSKAYQQHHVDIWHEYRVLDFIDITCWGLLNDIQYQDSFLFRQFWWDDETKKHDSIETTKRHAYELLHPKASRRLTASATVGQKF